MKSCFILRSRLLMRCAGRILQAEAILLCAAATLNTSMLSGAGWSEIDSGLPRTVPAVRSLAVDSATPSTLYAIDTSGRLFKSIDSGGSWRVRGSVTLVTFVAVDPTNSSTIYAATERGVFKSTDGGENWTGKPNRIDAPIGPRTERVILREADSGLAENYVWALAIDPRTPATLYAVTFDGVYKSTDAARRWNKLDTVPPDNYGGGIIKIDPVNPSTIYLAYAGNSGPSILKSTDGGQNWNKLNNTSGIVANTLVIDPINPSTLYALSSERDGNVLKSADGGLTWTVHVAIPPGSYVGSLAIDQAFPSIIYAVSSNGLGWVTSKSMDSGENWRVVNTGPPPSPGFSVAPVGLVAVSRTTPATVYTGYFDVDLQAGNLAKSTNAGATWAVADTGLTYTDVRAVAIDPVIPSNIYAGMGGLSTPLFKSVDGGASWTRLAQFQFGPYSWISAVLVGSANPNLIHAAVYSLYSYGTVFNTMDGGANWIPARLPVQTVTVMLDTAGSNTIYLGGDPDVCDEAELYKSVDGGSTWIHSYEWDGAPVSALAIDPTNAGALYAGTGGGVFKSADGGATWAKIGLTTGVTSLALDPGDPNTIYAAAGNFSAGFLGLFKSTDGGASWTAINKGLAGALDSRSTVNAIVVAPNNRSTLYVATSGRGVYKSVDGGASWAPFNDGLTNLDVRLMAVASNALYAVTSSGVFKVID
jgi:photosystem II stability/assembly factor-like uncharacterized protein